MQIFLVLLFAVLTVSHAQRVVRGANCPEVTPVKDFQLNSFLGTWYESHRYFTILEAGQSCNSIAYSLNSDKSLEVIYKAVSNIDGPVELRGRAALVGAPAGKLNINFPSLKYEVTDYILGTDYHNWAAVFNCKPLGRGLSHANSAWILTRDRKPSQAHITAALAAFSAQNLNTTALEIINQVNCK